MEIGIQMPHIGEHASASFVRAFCISAEAAGFDGLWTADHVVAPWHTDSEYTLGPNPTRIVDGAISRTMGLNLEMNTTLAFAAAVTSHVRLWTGVGVLPIRNPVLNARQLASIDLYSNGRLRYGAGVGWLREEGEAMGMPWDNRGKRSDEHIALMRALWTAEGETVEFHGEFFNLPPIDPNPRPVQRPIPILIGGHSEAALRRAARIGDGWIATRMSPGRLRQTLERLHELCNEHGRDGADMTIVCGERLVLDAVDGDPKQETAQIVSALLEYADMGVDHFKVALRADSRKRCLELLDIYATDILPVLSI
jgi:probable F420-dependent oxidoreductase